MKSCIICKNLWRIARNNNSNNNNPLIRYNQAQNKHRFKKEAQKTLNSKLQNPKKSASCVFTCSTKF